MISSMGKSYALISLIIFLGLSFFAKAEDGGGVKEQWLCTAVLVRNDGVRKPYMRAFTTYNGNANSFNRQWSALMYKDYPGVVKREHVGCHVTTLAHVNDVKAIPNISDLTWWAPRKEDSTESRNSDGDDSSPAWSEIFIKGAAKISDAYASRRAQESSSSGRQGKINERRNDLSLRAPLAPASCATYRASHYDPVTDSTYVEWRNVCSRPIEVHWCWLRSSENKCKTDNAGNILSPGEVQLVVGPNGKTQPLAAYYVCDMSDASKLCGGWD